tara:strand:- start:29 stop:622 length:594 start_codon:yes stop_codon:yes gene_type:complete
MKILKQILLLALIGVFSSCNRNSELNNSDFDLIPYSGNETLIFKSSENEIDSVFLNGLELKKHELEKPKSGEIEFYDLKAKIPEMTENHNFKGKSIAYISTSTDNQIYIGFELTLADDWIDGQIQYSVTNFKDLPLTTLKIGIKEFKDVKVLISNKETELEKTKMESQDRLYWSKSQGFLGLDKNGKEWRLINKYVP